MNPEVDRFLSNAENWQEELEKLRMICLDCQLTEKLKWGVPVYTFRGHNVIGINGLKESCALSFFKGALLADENGLLIKPGEHTQAGRWIKFISVNEIAELEPILKAYIFEAIEVETTGVKMDKKEPEPVPAELQKKLNEMPALKTAFNALTPGRQRAYILYFSAPKLAKTREARIEKYVPQILGGKGLNDAYLMSDSPK